MEVFLNRIDGIDDAIISMFLSKRTLTRDLELEVRNETLSYSNLAFDGRTPFGALNGMSECQRRGDFVVFRRTENVEKRRVKVYSLWIIILAVFACQA